jgi:acyl-CoA dehydrogenase
MSLSSENFRRAPKSERAVGALLASREGYGHRSAAVLVDFELSTAEREIKERAEAFARDHITPYASEFDRRSEFPRELVQRAYEAGLMNLHVPKSVGGLERTLLEETLVGEAIGYGCAGCASAIGCNNLALTPILLAGTKEQLGKYVKPLLAADEVRLASFCLTERESGSDAASIRTIAKRDGHEWVISGEKCFITNGPVASLHTVFATVDPSLRQKGISVFMVPADLPGVKIGHLENKLGQRASVQSEVSFENVRVPGDALLGREGDGFRLAMMTLDLTRAGIAAIATGVAQRAVDEASRFASTRKQFGQVIGMFEGVSFTLADMACRATASRHLTRHAAWLADRHLPNTAESAYAKWFASDSAMTNAVECAQIMGGYGYMEEYPAAKLIRDAKLLQIYEGTNQIQRVVASGVILKQAAKLDTGFRLEYKGKNAPRI